jgi:predicted nucleotidyltransferase
MDVVAQARSFVTDHHPDAVLALLGGSHARGTATATADLDIVVVDPTGDRAPMVAQVALALGALGGRVDETAPLVAPR